MKEPKEWHGLKLKEGEEVYGGTTDIMECPYCSGGFTIDLYLVGGKTIYQGKVRLVLKKATGESFYGKTFHMKATAKPKKNKHG